MILLVGASGTIGSSTVKALKEQAVPFKAGLRSAQKAAALGSEAVLFEWDRPETYGPALRGVKTLLLITPVSEKQVEWSRGLIQAAVEAGVRRLVKLSVIGADDEPGITIGRMHRETERDIEASGLLYTFLRPTFFMQNFVNFYGAKPDADSTIYLPNGEGSVSWIDARDVGEIAARTLTGIGHDGKSYTLTGGEAFSTAEACARLGAATGRQVRYVDISETAARAAMEKQGTPPALVTSLLELNAIIRNGWASIVTPDAEWLLGRPPRTFAQFAADLTDGQAFG